MTTLKMEVANLSKPSLTVELEFLIDSGIKCSVIPKAVLKRLGIRPLTDQEFRLWDGTTLTREKGMALYKYRDRVGGSDVVFGETGDCTLLGTLTLGALGLALDPLRRELKPLPMILASKN